ncbi:helix-turn-helix domain-containing protein [Terrabacter sp. Ter38]|uniref:helix-turn-helix domain-containing protein n=1 Tax=Terrabacter sp. Ter38 TaxID=2926030 RepID=UPI0021192516|nr:helix-turn-helix domain-containing protein [Terrabacter sp. Ter38]
MLDDTWFSRDMPVLEAAVALLEESRPPVSDSEIAARTGIDRQHVMKALEALEEDFLDVGWDDRADLRVSGVVAACTSAARRATGQWPSAESLAERAIAVVDERIENLPTTPSAAAGSSSATVSPAPAVTSSWTSWARSSAGKSPAPERGAAPVKSREGYAKWRPPFAGTPHSCVEVATQAQGTATAVRALGDS